MNSDTELKDDIQQEPVIVDNETVVQGIIGENRQKSRCIVKLTFIAGESAITSCLSALNGFFQQMQRMGNRKVIFLL